jgi:Zn-dependent M28 family amino/carboxypeptidase
MKRHLLLVPVALSAASLWAARDAAPSFSAARYIEHVKVLASPEMKGRGTGSPELEKAGQYIGDRFRRFGLKPVAGKEYRLKGFQVTTNARLGPNNRFTTNSRTLEPERDFVPFNFSSTGAAEGEVVFAGYGITAPEYHYDDYAGLDVKDKFVLIFRHEPQEGDENSVFNGKSFTSHAQFASKASNAKMHGAKGIVLVNDMHQHAADEDRFEKLQNTLGLDSAGIFFVQVKFEEAERMVAPAKKNLREIAAAIDRDLKPQSFALPAEARVKLEVDIQRDIRTVHNVAGYLPGQTDEYVVIGAHYDHLGLGGPNSLAPDQFGTPHHGADDNASGTAGLLELARYFASQPKQQRGILFLAFTGEELGLLGSNHYVNHPELPLSKAVAMINLDMIGRMQDSKVHVSGMGTGSTLKKTIDEIGPKYDLNLVTADQGGYGPSDHMSFTLKQVPVLFFFTALHKDYHRPSDTWDKINAAGSVKLLGMVAEITTTLANSPDRPQYVRLAQPAPAGGVGGGGGYGAYFGSIPDFTEIPNGVRFADVRDGSPAGNAGLKAGDILIEFDGKPIQNLHDFTYALRAKKPGQEVLVKVLRDGNPIEAKVLLTQRR